MTCYHSQTFRELVKKLCEEYKQLKQNEIYFTCRGLTMDLDKNLDDNGIQNKDTILINNLELSS